MGNCADSRRIHFLGRAFGPATCILLDASRLQNSGALCPRWWSKRPRTAEQQICLRSSFPAIFPGSATLVEEHKKQRKAARLGRNNPWQGSRWPRCRWCGERKYWSHCICGRCRAAYASSVELAGDDLRHAHLAHNLGCDLVSAEDARELRGRRECHRPKDPIENRQPESALRDDAICREPPSVCVLC